MKTEFLLRIEDNKGLGPFQYDLEFESTLSDRIHFTCGRRYDLASMDDVNDDPLIGMMFTRGTHFCAFTQDQFNKFMKVPMVRALFELQGVIKLLEVQSCYIGVEQSIFEKEDIITEKTFTGFCEFYDWFKILYPKPHRV